MIFRLVFCGKDLDQNPVQKIQLQVFRMIQVLKKNFMMQ